LNVDDTTTISDQEDDGTRFNIDKAASMLQALDVANEIKDASKLAFLMRPEVLGGLRRERIPQFSGQAVGSGMPLSMANILMSNEDLAKILGYPLASTTQLSKVVECGTSATCSEVICGAWEQFYVGIWRDLEISVSEHATINDQSIFLSDQFAIKATQMIDSNVGRATAFAKVSDAETDSAEWSV